MKKKVATIVLIGLLLAVAPRPVRAGYWGEDWASTIWQVTYEDMIDTIKKSMLASVQVTAIRVIQGRLSVLLTGSCGKYCIGGSGAAFITDWQDFIFGSAQRTADNVVTSFFSGINSGASSSMQKVGDNAQKALDNEVALLKKGPDLDDYVSEGKYSLIFDPTTSDPWKAWTVAGKPQNSVGYRWAQGVNLWQASYTQTSEKQATKATSYQGFTGTESKSSSSSSSYSSGKYGEAGYGTENEGATDETSGLTSLPGSLVQDMAAEVENMGTKLITFAQSIPQVVSGMVVQTLTNLINYGIKQVTDPIDKSITTFRNKVGTSISEAQSSVQSGARSAIYFNKK